MMSSKYFSWALAIGVAAVLSFSYLLDAPTEQQLAEASAKSLTDAQAQAARDAGAVRRERLELELRERVARGQTANLLAKGE